MSWWPFRSRFTKRNTDGDTFSVWKNPEGGVTVSIQSGWETITINTDPNTAVGLTQWMSKHFRTTREGPLAPVLPISTPKK